LLFTDVEGSTLLLNELGAQEYDEALAEHRRVLRGAADAADVGPPPRDARPASPELPRRIVTRLRPPERPEKSRHQPASWRPI